MLTLWTGINRDILEQAKDEPRPGIFKERFVEFRLLRALPKWQGPRCKL